MPKALYGEPSGSLKSIDGDSDSPVLVDQPPPLCTVQDSLPLSVDQQAKSSMGGPIGPPMVDDQSIPDLSDVTTELERLQPSDFQDPGDLTSSGSAPGCSPPCAEYYPRMVIPVPPPPPDNSGTQDGVGAAFESSPSSETVPKLPHIHGGPISPYQFTSTSFSPPARPVEHVRMSGNGATNHAPRRSHYSEMSDGPSRGSLSPEIVEPQILRVVPSLSGECVLILDGLQSTSLIRFGSDWTGMRRRGPEITPGSLGSRSPSPPPPPSPPPIVVLQPSGYPRPIPRPISTSRLPYPVPGFPMRMFACTQTCFSVPNLITSM